MPLPVMCQLQLHLSFGLDIATANELTRVWSHQRFWGTGSPSAGSTGASLRPSLPVSPTTPPASNTAQSTPLSGDRMKSIVAQVVRSSHSTLPVYKLHHPARPYTYHILTSITTVLPHHHSFCALMWRANLQQEWKAVGFRALD